MANKPTVISAGLRSIQHQGNSLMISLPKKELRDELGVEPEEAEEQSVRVTMNEDGEVTAELGSLLAD